MSRNTKIAISLVLLQSILLGFGDPISKNAYASISVYSLLTVRYWIAFIFIMLVFGRKVIKGLKGCDLKALILPSICIAATYLISNVAINLTSPTSVAFLRSTATVWTPLLALLVFRKHYSRKHLPILAFMMLGLYLLCCPDGNLKPGMGEICALLSAVMAAGSLVFAQDALDKADALTITAIQTLTSAVMATVCAFTLEGGVDMQDATPEIYMIILYLAVICTVGGYMLQNCALKDISASSVALLQCTYPVMTAFFSFFILSERLAFSGIAGSVIILLCVVSENFVSAREESVCASDIKNVQINI